LIVKKTLLAVPGLLLVAGCMAGPGPAHHTVDDYWNKQYQEEPIVTTALSTILPVYPIVLWISWIPDVLVFNTVQFWGYDAWDGKGAAWTHEQVTDPKTAWYDK
jgi:hypothetical protein